MVSSFQSYILKHPYTIRCWLGRKLDFPRSLTSMSFVISAEELIEVDVEHSERNHGVYILYFTNVENDGILHDGFEVTLEVDFRDLLDDKYSAHLLPSGNEIMLRMPSMSYSFLYESEKYDEQLKNVGLHCPRTQEAQDVERNHILSDNARQTRLVLLRFPSHMELSNLIYSPKSQDGEIDFEPVSYASNAEFNGQIFPMIKTRVSWKVSLVEPKMRVVRASANAKQKCKTKLANCLGRINLNS